MGDMCVEDFDDDEIPDAPVVHLKPKTSALNTKNGDLYGGQMVRGDARLSPRRRAIDLSRMAQRAPSRTTRP